MRGQGEFFAGGADGGGAGFGFEGGLGRVEDFVAVGGEGGGSEGGGNQWGGWGEVEGKCGREESVGKQREEISGEAHCWRQGRKGAENVILGLVRGRILIPRVVDEIDGRQDGYQVAWRLFAYGVQKSSQGEGFCRPENVCLL